MLHTFIVKLGCFAYRKIFRDEIKRAIQDPNKIISEFALIILDEIFNYKE